MTLFDTEDGNTTRQHEKQHNNVTLFDMEDGNTTRQHDTQHKIVTLFDMEDNDLNAKLTQQAYSYTTTRMSNTAV